jgi:lipid-A-disaccharide synthase-like uncharacterized protein
MASHFNVDLWEVIGLLGQALFAGRFYVQLIASERRKQSYIPLAFWYLSILGGTTLLVYSVHLRSLTFILGQAGGLVVYARNLVLIRRRAGGTGAAA